MSSYIRNRRKRYNKKRKESSPKDDYICFYEMVKRWGSVHPIKFVIEDDDRPQLHVYIDAGGMKLNGTPKNDADARKFIAKIPSEFGQLFLESASKYSSESKIMQDIYIAKIADKAGAAGTKAKIEISDNGIKRELAIGRNGTSTIFMIDGVSVSANEAKRFIGANYTEFLIGMKKAINDIYLPPAYTQNRHTHNDIDENKYPKSKIVDGKLIVDIDGFLPKSERKKASPKDKPQIMLGGQIINKKKRGHIE